MTVHMLCKLDDLIHTHPGETWAQALERFSKLCRVDLLEYDDDDEKIVVNLSEIYDEGELYELMPPLAEDEILTYERQHGLVIPAPLRHVLLQTEVPQIYMARYDHGRYGERRVLDFYHSDEPHLFPNVKTLLEALAYNYGPYFSDEELDTAEREALNQRFFAFAARSNDDHAWTYLLFDREGHFGEYEFETENYPRSLARIRDLLVNGLTETDFDAFMCRQIDILMTYILQYNEVID
ncbi:hypothetical protein [Chitinibacter sp. GC72]|uniref:hypothetical protein n=1 Tax=Chitinibacter sp. GC72 TaxID=1526917 RepID=UPI0012F91BF5|nr:hypothetical protein [Chitinibacter sp. GC72]